MLASVKVPGSYRILVRGTLDLPLCECTYRDLLLRGGVSPQITLRTTRGGLFWVRSGGRAR
jgi:hypothetical protein